MKLAAGTKLRSTVCKMEGIVIREPQQDGMIECGGQSMVEAKQPASTSQELSAPEPSQALIGKRYVDEESGLEILCTKQGLGALSFAGRALTLKQAKPLPSSD